jgi:hypothetical protein
MASELLRISALSLVRSIFRRSSSVISLQGVRKREGGRRGASLSALPIGFDQSPLDLRCILQCLRMDLFDLSELNQ